MRTETYRFEDGGHHWLVALDHETACDLVRTAGHEPPAIPAGCNVGWKVYRDADGRPSVAVNQTGVSPVAADNERQVNGCAVITLLDGARLTEDEQYSALRHVVRRIIGEDWLG